MATDHESNTVAADPPADPAAGAGSAPDPLGESVEQAQALLAAATAILDGHTNIPPRRRTRAAALLARTAVEVTVGVLLQRAAMHVDGASSRVKFICLRVIDRAAAAQAEVTWAGLSRSCHEHAYELSPTTVETRHLVQAAVGLIPPNVAVSHA